MGGNAFKSLDPKLGLEPQRILNQEFNNTVASILPKLQDIFSKIEVLRFYKNKPDHGDIDLIAYGPKTQDWQTEVAKQLNSQAKVWNKPTASFCIYSSEILKKPLQLDISLTTSLEEFATTKDYSDFSPLGNILGKIIRTTGAKWGLDGLKFVVEDESKQPIKEIHLTSSIDEILNFCGLDPKLWHNGFETQEDIFSYTCQCRFFNKSAFEILNHRTRKRDKTRPDYHAWTQYIKDKCPKDKPLLSKEESFSYLCQSFPNLKSQVEEIISKDKEIRLAKKTKFNGELVQQWTSMLGPMMGEAIADFKSKFKSKADFEQYLVQTPATQIKKQFLDGLKPSLE